jgi:hypothetical protein
MERCIPGPLGISTVIGRCSQSASSVTHAGEKKWRSVDDGVQKLEERLLQGLTRDEVRVLNRSLETIIRNLTPTA